MGDEAQYNAAFYKLTCSYLVIAKLIFSSCGNIIIFIAGALVSYVGWCLYRGVAISAPRHLLQEVEMAPKAANMKHRVPTSERSYHLCPYSSRHSWPDKNVG